MCLWGAGTALAQPDSDFCPFPARSSRGCDLTVLQSGSHLCAPFTEGSISRTRRVPLPIDPTPKGWGHPGTRAEGGPREAAVAPLETSSGHQKILGTSAHPPGLAPTSPLSRTRALRSPHLTRPQSRVPSPPRSRSYASHAFRVQPLRAAHGRPRPLSAPGPGSGWTPPGYKASSPGQRYPRRGERPPPVPLGLRPGSTPRRAPRRALKPSHVIPISRPRPTCHESPPEERACLEITPIRPNYRCSRQSVWTGCREPGLRCNESRREDGREAWAGARPASPSRFEWPPLSREVRG